MKTVTFTEFRNHASEFLDLVERGETVRVVRHGKPVAKIVPAGRTDRAPSWKLPGLRLIAPGTAIARAVLEERRSSR
ncbi:MAG: type II toxin-antitoxin system Phd/YefM family antitoxin [Nitrospirae bacterium]|nr:type II toxin-antitoxin system Phd/YefM family antitoxin [Nitrospirota bacterium]